MNTVLLKLKAFARYLQRGRYQKLWTEEAFVHLETRQADSVSGEHCASLTVKACLPLAKTTVLAETYFWINNIKLFWSESSYEHLSVWRHANILKVPMRLNKRGDVCMFFLSRSKMSSHKKCPVCCFYLLRSPFCVRFFSFSFLSCLASLSFSRCILSISFFFCASSRAWTRFCFCLFWTSSTLVFLNSADVLSKGQLDKSRSAVLMCSLFILHPLPMQG